MCRSASDIAEEVCSIPGSGYPRIPQALVLEFDSHRCGEIGLISKK